jgi:hypothetical protein
MRKREEPDWKTLTIEIDGRTVSGSYAYNPRGKLVEVRTFNGHKATQLGGSRPESIARLLLHELAKEGKA